MTQKDSSLPSLAHSGEDFFESLLKAPFASEALRFFSRFHTPPHPLSPVKFQALLLEVFLQHLLDHTGLSGSPGATYREWRSLFSLGLGIDPRYFTEADLARAVEAGPPLSVIQKQDLVGALKGFFLLMGKGFPESYPHPLLSETELNAWAELPLNDWLGWGGWKILKAIGLYPLASAEAWRVYVRYTEGVFSPPLKPQDNRQWRALLTEAATKTGQTPHALEFLVELLATGRQSLNVAGWCGDVPRCDTCPLSLECRWAQREKNPENMAETLAVAASGQPEKASTSRLFQALFDTPEKNFSPLAAALEETPLRVLARKSDREKNDWAQSAGLEPGKVQILAELALRMNAEQLEPGVLLSSVETVYQHFRPRLQDARKEYLLAVMLDVKHRFLAESMISQGTLENALVHPREVFYPAIVARAASIIIVHNHPSGDPTPSKEDLEVTRTLVETGHLVGIPVLDHIIIGGNDYISLLELGLVKF